MDCIVVYYSRSGNTKKAAEMIAAKLGCGSIAIVDPDKRKGIFGFLRSGFQAAMKTLPKIQPMENDLSVYNNIILCTPIWASNMASPVRTFLDSYNSIKTLSCFATCIDPKEDGKHLMQDLMDSGFVIESFAVAPKDRLLASAERFAEQMKNIL